MFVTSGFVDCCCLFVVLVVCRSVHVRFLMTCLLRSPANLFLSTSAWHHARVVVECGGACFPLAGNGSRTVFTVSPRGVACVDTVALAFATYVQGCVFVCLCVCLFACVCVVVVHLVL